MSPFRYREEKECGCVLEIFRTNRTRWKDKETGKRLSLNFLHDYEMSEWCPRHHPDNKVKYLDKAKLHYRVTRPCGCVEYHNEDDPDWLWDFGEFFGPPTTIFRCSMHRKMERDVLEKRHGPPEPSWKLTSKTCTKISPGETFKMKLTPPFKGIYDVT